MEATALEPIGAGVVDGRGGWGALLIYIYIYSQKEKCQSENMGN